MFNLKINRIGINKPVETLDKIPKIIHHIWMGKNEIPDLNIKCAESIKKQLLYGMHVCTGLWRNKKLYS